MTDYHSSRRTVLAESTDLSWGRLLAELREDGPGHVPPHHASGIEIHLHVGPAVTVHWSQDGQHGSTRTPAGRAVILRDRPYSHRVWSDSARYIRIVIKRDDVTTDPSLAARVPIGCWPAPGDSFASLGTLLEDELQRPAFHGNLFAELVLGVLLHHAASVSEEHGPSDLSAEQMEATIEFLLANIEAPIQVLDMAAHVGMSQYAFSRALKRSTGHSPYQLVQILRIERARFILNGSDWSGAAIAASLGFHDEAHFSKAFKRVTGLPPRAWRDLNRR